MCPLVEKGLDAVMEADDSLLHMGKLLRGELAETLLQALADFVAMRIEDGLSLFGQRDEGAPPVKLVLFFST